MKGFMNSRCTVNVNCKNEGVSLLDIVLDSCTVKKTRRKGGRQDDLQPIVGQPQSQSVVS